VFSVAYSASDGAAYAGCEPSALWVQRDGAWGELSALRELPSVAEVALLDGGSVRVHTDEARPVRGARLIV
jgi:hypothetical protein